MLRAITLSFVMLMRWSLYHLRMRGWLSVEPTQWLEGWNFESYPETSGEGWGVRDGVQLPMAKDLINHTYLKKPPWNLRRTKLEESPGWWTRVPPHVTQCWLQSLKERSLFLFFFFFLQDLALCISSSSYWFISLNILCNKLIIYGENWFPEFWTALAN